MTRFYGWGGEQLLSIMSSYYVVIEVFCNIRIKALFPRENLLFKKNIW